MFYSYNPVKLIHGVDTLGRIRAEIPQDAKRLLIIHGTSLTIYRNELMQALNGSDSELILDFIHLGGDEPTVETIKQALQKITTPPDYILGFGGGSVLDATKAIAVCYGNQISAAQLQSVPSHLWYSTIPFGLVCTKPGSGSEGNNAFVLMEDISKKKISYFSIHSYPRFSLHDASLFASLAIADFQGGIADAVSHVIDQYLVVREPSLIQDSMSLNCLRIAAELSKRAESPTGKDFLDLAWFGSICSSGILARGVKTSWIVHEVAHSLASVCGIRHAESIANIIELVMSFDRHPIDRLSDVATSLAGLPSLPQLSKEQAVAQISLFFRNLGLTVGMSNLSEQQLVTWYAHLAGLCPALNSKEIGELCKSR